jgi:hypothetical protein
VTPHRQTRIIRNFLVGLIVGALTLIVFGFVKSTRECEDKGGRYVGTTTGYDCVQTVP